MSISEISDKVKKQSGERRRDGNDQAIFREIPQKTPLQLQPWQRERERN